METEEKQIKKGREEGGSGDRTARVTGGNRRRADHQSLLLIGNAAAQTESAT